MPSAIKFLLFHPTWVIGNTFAYIGTKDSKQLYISKPVLGRSSGKWSIQMTRRVNNGWQFWRCRVISMDPFYFTEFYKELDIGKKASVTLVGTDGIVRARQSGQDSEIGQDVRKSALMNKAAKDAKGSFISSSAVDSFTRFIVFAG